MAMRVVVYCEGFEVNYKIMRNLVGNSRKRGGNSTPDAQAAVFFVERHRTDNDWSRHMLRIYNGVILVGKFLGSEFSGTLIAVSRNV